MTDVCQAYDEDDPLAAYNLHNLATVRAISELWRCNACCAAQAQKRLEFLTRALRVACTDV